MTQIVIGTSGHIDHGKTALVKALTGTDTDRLEQEKERGMTIDLGFAFLDDSITIIDVPGHEKFIRNMVAGVSTIHIALLVIAADDGIMPQTREHLNIISLLGIKKAVIALTKIDLVSEPEWIDLVEEEIRDILLNTPFEDAPIVRTSVNPETGIDTLRTQLIETASFVQNEKDRGFFRMQVDRVFVKKGFGVVTTGTVLSGKLSVGDDVVCLPEGEKRKVRGIQSHGNSVQNVTMGDRAAINISGLSKEQVWRGSELVEQGFFKPTKRIIVNISMIQGTGWQIKSKQRVRVHIGTSEVLGRITLTDSTLKQGETGNCIIALEEPIIAAMDDRFVIRSYSPMETIAGGKILDPDPTGSWKEIKLWAQDFSRNSDERYLQFISRHWISPKSVADWSSKFHITREDLLGSLSTNIEIMDELCVTKENLMKSKTLFTECVETFHKHNPYRAFIGLKSLQDQLGFSSTWFEVIKNILISENMIKHVESGFAMAEHEISISDKDKDKANLVLSNLSRTPNLVLTEKELFTEIGSSVVKILHALKAQHRVIEIQQGMWMDYQHLVKIQETIRRWFDTHDILTVPEFKESFGLTRKTAIPILEYLDKNRMTVRRGNDRLKGEKL